MNKLKELILYIARYKYYFFLLLINFLLTRDFGPGLYRSLLKYLLIVYFVYIVVAVLSDLLGEGWFKKIVLFTKNIVFQLCLVLGVLFGIEFLFQGIMLPEASDNVDLQKDADRIIGEYNVSSKIVGWMPNADNSGRYIKIRDHDTVYNVVYSFDSAGRRTFPEPKRQDYKMHSIFLGCSFTFGEGLPPEGTYAAILNSIDTNIHCYNYGMTGWGPHQSVQLFEKLNRINSDVIKEDSGICLYTFIDDHLVRVYGGMRYLEWGAASPEVEFDKEGNMISHERNSFKYRLLRRLGTSAVGRYFGADYPKSFPKSFYKDFAKLINYTAKAYNKKFPKGKFCIAIFPNESQVHLDWLQYIDTSRVKVLNLPKLIPRSSEDSAYKYYIKGDGHPKKNANEIFMKEVYKQVSQ